MTTSALPATSTPDPPSEHPLDALPVVDPAATARLHARLEVEAGEQDLIDVAYRTLDTPVGCLLLAATRSGLVRVAFPTEDHDAVLERLAVTISPRIVAAPARLDTAATEIDEYFAGRRRAFDLPLDLQLTTTFRALVLEQLRGIAYGSTASYTAMAAAAGNPRATRAVGTACATNPVPIVVPCHRVLRSDGTIGQYLGGTEVKRTLLAMESAA